MNNINSKLIGECDYSPEEVNAMTNKEKFKAVLEWEGIIGYTNFIFDLVNDIYGIDLNNF